MARESRLRKDGAALITVVVPSLSATRTRSLLDSLAAQTIAHRAIVVDNGSPSSEVSELCNEFAFAEAVRVERNVGFSRAVNLGASRAAGAALVLVNDDATYDPDFLQKIVEPLDPAAGVRMVSGATRSAAEPGLIDSAGIEIDRTLLAYDYLQGHPLAELAAAPPPFGPSGVAAAFDLEAFRRIGGFDEAIFAYLEDLDLALRMRLAGSSCSALSSPVGTHEHSATLGSGSARKDRLMGISRGYLLRKWSVLGPMRLPGVIARELVICAGQAAFDRTLAGVAGRVHGLRLAPHQLPYPAALIEREATLSLVESLTRRARRKGRLRRAG